MSGSLTTAQSVQANYQHILARTGSASEVTYWVNEVTVSGMTLPQVQNDFATSTEALTNVAPIIQMYQADLGRAADNAGLTYYVGLEESGTSLATIGAFIASSAESQTFNNFTIGTAPTDPFVAALYTSMLGRAAALSEETYWVGSGLTDAGIVAAIGSSAEATTFSLPKVTSYLATGGGALSSPTTGNTFTLTTGADNPTLVANETVTGLVDNAVSTSDSTLTAADTVAGIAGGQNALTVTTIGGGGTVTNGALVSNIATVNVRNTVAGAANYNSLDASTITGLTAVDSYLSPGDLYVYKLAAGASASVIGNGTVASGTLTAAYVDAATAATINISGGTLDTNPVYVGGVGLTSATVNSTGAANSIGGLKIYADAFPNGAGETVGGTSLLTSLAINAATDLVTGGITGAALKTITVGGGATNATTGTKVAVNLGNLQTAAGTVTSVDASKLTNGGVAVTLDIALTSFKGGANGNVVTTAAVAATAASSINAGTGTGNTLVIAASTDVSTPTLAALFAGFNTLTDNEAVPAGPIDVSKFTNSAITAENVSGGANLSGLSAAQAAAITVTAGSSTPTLAVTGASSLNPATIGLTVNDGATGATTLTGIAPSATFVGTVDLTVGNANDTAGVNLAGVTSLQHLVIAGPGIANVVTGLTSAVSVTLDGVSGNTVSLAAETAGGSQINLGTSAAQTITLGTAHTLGDQIIVGADADAVYGTKGSATTVGDVVQLINFTSSATPGHSDQLTFTATAGVGPTTLANAATITAAQTGVTGLTGAVAGGTGLVTFTGTATLAQEIFATENVLNAAGGNQIAFFTANSVGGTAGVADNTYVVETPSAGASLATDHVFQIAGATSTSIGTTAGVHNILVG